MHRIPADSLDWALAHVLRFGDTDVLPVPFEYDAIKGDWDRIKQYLLDQDALQWQTRPHRILLAPKGRYAFRVITQQDPLDCLVFLALVHEIGSDLERHRVPITAHAAFSYRFAPLAAGQMFDPKIRYAEFHARSLELARPSSDFTHIALADIADFYPRIYRHRLDNALLAATLQHNPVKAISRILNEWSAKESIGLPIGGTAARLLAEMTLADVDELLLAEDIRFIRYVDDYRIFTTSRDAAYRALVLLAETLQRNHNLTLQPQKTRVLSTTVFAKEFGLSERDRELASLRSRFLDLVTELGGDPYEPIPYESLSPNMKKRINAMNLIKLLEEAVAAKPEPDYSVVRFVLARLATLRDGTAVDLLLEAGRKLYPVLSNITDYLIAVAQKLPSPATSEGEQLVALFDDPLVGALPYHRLLLAGVAAADARWCTDATIIKKLNAEVDVDARRKLVLALRRTGHRSWFQGQWRHLDAHPAWLRRAVLAGVSCLPGDAGKHFVKGWEARLDPLERAVAKWALANPI